MAWIGSIVGAVLLAAAIPEPSGVEQLGWLGGAWVSEGEDGWTEEFWMEPRGGVMLGVNRSGKGERLGIFEYMRIAEDAHGGVAFWASPGGKPASAFPLVSTGPGEAVFANPAHDFPTRIVYRRVGDVLLATISGASGANAQSWRFRRPPTRVRQPVRLER